MKKISLSHYSRPDKSHWKTSWHYYGVFLGADLGRVEFKTLSQCKKFLALVSGRLNTILYGLNENYVQAFTLYRQVWPYLDNNEAGQAASQEISQLIINLERSFDRVTLFGGESECFVCQTLQTIISNLARWWDLLSGVYYRRSDWSGVARCAWWQGQLNRLGLDLNQAGQVV